MSQHLVAFYQSVDPAGVYVQLDAVQDPALTTNGKFAYVPNGLANIIGAAAFGDVTVAPLARVSSPSLRQLTDLQVRPVFNQAVASSQSNSSLFGGNSLPLLVNEGLEFDVNDNPAAASDHYGFVWLADSAPKPTSGNIFTTRATAAAALAAGKWINSNLTFDETLPSGQYQVVGMRAEGANLRAARLVFIGGTFRPGVIAATNGQSEAPNVCRFGGVGVLGQFDNTTPPTVDCLGITDAAQAVFLDLIKVK